MVVIDNPGDEEDTPGARLHLSALFGDRADMRANSAHVSNPTARLRADRGCDHHQDRGRDREKDRVQDEQLRQDRAELASSASSSRRRDSYVDDRRRRAFATRRTTSARPKPMIATSRAPGMSAANALWLNIQKLTAPAIVQPRRMKPTNAAPGISSSTAPPISVTPVK